MITNISSLLVQIYSLLCSEHLKMEVGKFKIVFYYD